MGTTSEKKRMGRPPTGRTRAGVTARFDADVLKAIEAWAREHGIERSEAIRRLVELGLKSQSIGRGKWWTNRKPVHD